MKTIKNEVKPGRNPNLVTSHFDNEEENIIDRLSGYFYVTNGGRDVQHYNANYRYCLVKLPSDKKNLFGIDFEILLVFSPYEKFEPRTLDIIEKIEKDYINSSFRLDKICTIIISKCNSFEHELSKVIKKGQESRIVIPFTYNELLDNEYKINFFDERIRKYFFERDLFDVQAPLTKDLYFFGRDEVVISLIDKHEQGENAGIFGLRKIGKTSILYAVNRILSQKGGCSVVIDCQNLYQGRWNYALYDVIDNINAKLALKMKFDREEYENESLAAKCFDNDIKRICNKLKSKSILLIFDEIEHLSYKLSANEYWKTGHDYLYFWHAVRASFQTSGGKFTFLLAGTNANSIELSKIENSDNPLFEQFKPIYLSGFNVEQTKQMISTLSRYMGVKFDDEIFTYLTDNFGGHPFLIRKICSFLLKKARKLDIQHIDKDFYHKYYSEFDSHSYCQMVINVLHDFYKDEYTMLEYLAQGDINNFNELANDDESYVRHLLGYRVIRKSNDGNYHFNIDVIKQFLIKKNKYQSMNLSEDEKRSEISYRRNKIEEDLKELIRKCIRDRYGRTQALEKVNAILKTSIKDYNDLFDSNKNNKLYFLSLLNIIIDNDLWNDCFKTIFSNKTEFESKMNLINRINIGRADAHNAKVSDEDFNLFRSIAKYLEKIIEENKGKFD